MLKIIIHELKEHAPITFGGALLGIVFMFIFKNLSHEASHNLFYVFHPLHVLLSALATAGMYQHYQCLVDRKKCNIFALLCIGYVGAIGVATMSDSIMPYVAETFLNMPHREMHVGFMEKPLLINAMAIIGVIIAYCNPSTKFPHFGHVLLSTWASLFHVMMAKMGDFDIVTGVVVVVFLFLSVWLPCCISDIVFPLLFVKGGKHLEHKH